MARTPSTKAREKQRSRVKRAVAIALVAAGVFLEVAANVVQLAESDLVHRAVAETLRESIPAKVHAALRASWD